MNPTIPVASSDAPAWVAGIGTLAAVFVALTGLVYQNWNLRREREHRLAVEAEASFARKSEQARRVSAHTTGGGTAPVQLNVINASDLMVTDFEAVAFAEYPPGNTWKGSFYPPGIVIVIPPGSGTKQMPSPAMNIPFRHEIAFNDDNGVRWHKYGGEGLREVSRDFTLCTDLSWAAKTM